jgi:hypothetical protein
MPEQASISHDPQSAFTQHCEAAEGSDGIWIEVHQLAPKKVHDSNKKLAGRKP